MSFVQNQLPDGGKIRALEGTFTQKQMFNLAKSGLYHPANETIMSVKEHDHSIHSGAYRSVNINGWWRTRKYCFYPKGFERADLPLGDKIIYVEDGIAHTLHIPDVPLKVNGKNVGLRQSVGMGILSLEKLQYDEDSHIVSVTSDFDPATDVKVIDVMRPRDWALVDENGIPVRSMPSDGNHPEARYFHVRNERELEGSTGYHGSLARRAYGSCGGMRLVYADREWSFDMAVALVGPGVLAQKLIFDNLKVLVGEMRALEYTRIVAPEDLGRLVELISKQAIPKEK